jgi:hypothetical protein
VRGVPLVGTPSGPVAVDETKVLERIEVSELPVDETFMYTETIDLPTRPGTQTRRRAPIPGLTSFAISLDAYIEKATEICPLCGHDEDTGVSDGEEEEIDETFMMTISLSLLFSEQSIEI